MLLVSPKLSMANNMKVTLPTYNYLQLVRFKSLSLWDVKKNRIFENKETSNFQFAKLGDILTQVKRVENLTPNVEYKLLGVKSYGLGAFHREVKKGSEIKAKYLWELKEGDFVYSRLGASSGSFGLITKEFDNYFVSNEFPAFTIDKNKVNPQFLNLVLSSKRFYERIKDFNTGSALKRFHEDKFLNLEIPLPSLKEQSELVNNYYSKVRQLNNTISNVEIKEIEIKNNFFSALGILESKKSILKRTSNISFVKYKDIRKWSLSSILKEKVFSFDSVKFKTTPLHKVLLTFEGGKTPLTTNKDYWNGNIYWVSPKDFNGLEIFSSQDKITEKAVSNAGMKVFKTGVLLAVFRSGILRHSFPIAITKIPVAINQDLKALEVNNEIIFSEYLLFYLHYLQSYVLENCVKYGVTVESVNTDEFLNLDVILPSLSIQKKLIQQLVIDRTDVANMREFAKKEMDNAIIEFDQKIFNTK